ncbi:SDR family NAD(P)-dependent oxidoreductase [Flammeovirga agarivorans]|uniref:SDR family NAD(P)-dependent oxidoreductase n=1 Tax=Flammeovirga agarivorans TaxID=2726742 RepID=A0A7X8SQC3_9BACT|nr:SDR family NAD(P)-dependent oxidoreductase [Flammeovirga agarivorans]NLR94405.1 SDR family NAD(P)-dependent oxidoreductase [Flammeovirga agarivorans]
MKKTILITGSTDGIGKLAAIQLAKDGHIVYIHGRNVDKLNVVVEEIKKLSTNEHVNGFIGDLSDTKGVQSLANDILNQLDHLDVLINNAGVFKSTSANNQQGIDLRIAVNYYAPYILTNALLPILKKGNHPRIINLSSAAQAPVSLELLKGKAEQNESSTYAQSKLALTMWSFDLARQEKDITVIPVNPGSLLNTNMVKEAYGKFWSSADKGSQILYDLATSEEHAQHSGEYFDNDAGKYNKAHSDAYQKNKIKDLLAVTSDMTQL